MDNQHQQQNPQNWNYQAQPGQAPPPYQQPPRPRKKHTARNVVLAIAGVFVLFVGGCTAMVASIGGSADDATKQPASSGASAQPVDNGPTPDPLTTPTNKPPATTKTTKPPANPTPKVTKPAMTVSQEQAVGSAESYLSYKAFSRKGLIQQLSSQYGEGFSKSDATYAVDHITVNWNEQAAKSAKAYLQMKHFSRNGLIQQLESRYGEQFTHAQAVYGVTKAGL